MKNKNFTIASLLIFYPEVLKKFLNKGTKNNISNFLNKLIKQKNKNLIIQMSPTFMMKNLTF